MTKQKGSVGESLPSGGKVIGVDKGIDGRVWMHDGHFVGERIVLEDLKPANFGWFWDNGEGRGLEGPIEGFNIYYGQWLNGPSCSKLISYNLHGLGQELNNRGEIG